MSVWHAITFILVVTLLGGCGPSQHERWSVSMLGRKSPIGLPGLRWPRSSATGYNPGSQREKGDCFCTPPRITLRPHKAAAVSALEGSPGGELFSSLAQFVQPAAIEP